MKKVQILSLVAGAGLLAGCSSWGNHNAAAGSVTLDQLPPAAQSTVRNEIGDQPIYGITQESVHGQTAYKVEVDRNGFGLGHPSVTVSQDGAVLKESRKLSLAHRDINEAAGAQNNDGSARTPSSSPDSTQAPSEANPSGTNPARALPSSTPGQ